MTISSIATTLVPGSDKTYTPNTSKGKKLNFMSALKYIKNIAITVLKNLFKYHFSRSEKEGKTNMRDLISKSYVVPDSGGTATKNFANAQRFNGIINEVTPAEKQALLEDNIKVMSGNILPLTGKGIISGKSKDDTLPVTYDYVRNDAEAKLLNQAVTGVGYGIESYKGSEVKSEEIIPGTPMGNYYNKQIFNDKLNVIRLNNGDCGTVALRFDVNQLSPGTPLLIHGGALSGSTVAYGLKGDYFYAFHSGKPGNSQSVWKTETDGAKSVMDSHKRMTASTATAETEADIPALSRYLNENFDISMMAYYGRGENVVSEENSFVFDYNKPSPSAEDNKSKVANAMAILVNERGVINVQMVSDDMEINKFTLKTESVAHLSSGLIKRSGS